MHEERAAGAAALAGAAAVGQAEGGPVVHARRDLDGEGRLPHRPPLAAALGARVRNHVTCPAASGARDARDDLAEERLADAPLLARTLAVDALHGLGARSRPSSRARGTRRREADGDLLAAPEDGLGEAQPETDLGVGAGLGPAPPPASPGDLPEERLEDVAQVAFETEPAHAALRPEDAFGAVAVVPGSALGVAQHLVGDGDLLEARLGLGVAVVGVGVQLARPGPVGLLDLVVAGVGAHPEQRVQVARSQRRPSPPPPRRSPRRSPTMCAAAIARE